MALNGNAVVLPGVGYVLLSDVGAPPPDKSDITPSTLAQGDDIVVGTEPDTATWRQLGHTSRENAVALGKEGGETTALGSWQAPTLKTSVSPITYSFTISALQFDNDVLSLYFGGGDTSQQGYFGIPKTTSPTEKALYLALVDGTAVWGEYFPKVSIIGGDGPELSPEGLTEWQLVATILDPGTAEPTLGRIYGEGLGAAT